MIAAAITSVTLKGGLEIIAKVKKTGFFIYHQI